MSYMSVFFILSEAGIYKTLQRSFTGLSWYPKFAVSNLSFTIFFTVITEISSLPLPRQFTHTVLSANAVPQMWLIIESMLAFLTEKQTPEETHWYSWIICTVADMTFYPLKQYGPLY